MGWRGRILNRGAWRGGREPAFGNAVVKAGIDRGFDDTADGGGRRALAEDRYVATVEWGEGENDKLCC